MYSICLFLSAWRNPLDIPVIGLYCATVCTVNETHARKERKVATRSKAVDVLTALTLWSFSRGMELLCCMCVVQVEVSRCAERR